MGKIDTAMMSGALTILDLIIVLVGSFVTARAVIMTDDAAIMTDLLQLACPSRVYASAWGHGEQRKRRPCRRFQSKPPPAETRWEMNAAGARRRR
jgi:hypothetical protein